MENSVTTSFAKTSQALADKAADTAQSGVRIAQGAVKDAGNHLSSKIEDVRSEAGTAVSRGSRRVQSAGRQGLDAMTNASESIMAYTKKNPLKALAIAAASGAALYAVIKALSPSRD